MNRNLFINYLVIAMGLAASAFGGIGYYIKKAYAYQIENNLPPKIQADSFWLTFNTEPFMVPGMAVAIFATVFLVLSYTRSVGKAPEPAN